VVPLQLPQTVAAQLLAERVGQLVGHHGLPPRLASLVTRSTDARGFTWVAMGFMAARRTSGCPVVIPPSSPPPKFVRRVKPAASPCPAW
jgi:hypothetical protein